MRSRIFCKKFKSLTFVVLSALLILPTILNVVKFTTPTFAEVDNNKSYAIELYDRNGNLIANTTAQGRTLFANNGTDDISLSYVIAGEGSTDSNGNYPDCILGNNARCQLIIRNNGSIVATVSIPADKLTNLQIRSIVQITPNGTTCAPGSNSGDCLSSEIYATDFGSPTGYGYIDSYGSGSTAGNTIPIATALSQYFDPAKEPESSEPQTEATCHSASGAVGWVVCPILELAASASVWAYKNVIEPSLVLRTSLFSTDGSNNGTYRAWSVFRNIANVVFVILLLFIIFSQVTGLGIDNYGIKKTLPKLIVAAILVNISFFICQLLVDVSNIVGSGVYSTIDEIGAGITVPESALGGLSYTTSIINTIALAIGGTFFASSVMGGFWTMISAALLAVLPVFISAVVAILFLFFLLAMRQAIVVMLVAISPLAFVCYTLPNTKRLFDRWTELLRGMLVLYPICAVMIAGGRLASKIILSSGAAENNLFIILIAMVAEAGPLFLIPGLTRSAYRATGQLGTTLNGLRGRLTGGARGLVRNNQRYQNAQARNQRRRITSNINRRRGLVNRYNAANERLQEGASGYAPGLSGRVRRMRDYVTTRAGNRERVANLNEQALAAEEQQRKLDRMSDATQVAGMRQQQQISANQQNVKNADYADATFANAVITQAEIDHSASRDRQMLYSRDEYATSRRNANNAVLSNEVTKMYSDQFSRMSMGEVIERLNSSIAGANVENRAEQFTAASDALIRSGQADKVREVISGGADGRYADAATNFGELIQKDKTFRDRASQVLGSSGEFTFQEYAKHLGQSALDADGNSTAQSFQKWSDADDGLKASIATKGLDKMDKDGFAFLANHLNALSGASNENIAKIAASTTDAATVGKLADAIGKLDSTRREQIMAATSGAQFVSMNENVRVALSGGGTAGDAAWKKAVGDALASDPQLRGRLTAAEQGRYVGASSGSQGQQRLVIDHSTSGRPTDENGRTIPFPGPNNGR